MVENKFEFLQYVKSYDFYMKPPGKKKRGGAHKLLFKNTYTFEFRNKSVT